MLERDVVLAVRDLLLDILGQRPKLRAKILIVNESFLLVPHVNECSVETWHQLLDARQVDVAHREARILAFALVFGELAVFEETDGDLLRLHIDNDFACHCANSKWEIKKGDGYKKNELHRAD